VKLKRGSGHRTAALAAVTVRERRRGTPRIDDFRAFWTFGIWTPKFFSRRLTRAVRKCLVGLPPTHGERMLPADIGGDGGCRRTVDPAIAIGDTRAALR
jgi:hypothetical protein